MPSMLSSNPLDALKSKIGVIFYDAELNRFVRIHEVRENKVIVFGPCEFYGDARTTKNTSELPVSHATALTEIKDEADLSKVAEILKAPNGEPYGWCVKGMKP